MCVGHEGTSKSLGEVLLEVLIVLQPGVLLHGVAVHLVRLLGARPCLRKEGIPATTVLCLCLSCSLNSLCLCLSCSLSSLAEGAAQVVGIQDAGNLREELLNQL